MVTVFWLWAEVEKIFDCLLGMTVLLKISLVITPAAVWIPMVRELSSSSTISP